MSLKRIGFHITGFGKFAGVEHNPSTEIVNSLCKTNLNYEILSTNVIQVSAIDVMFALNQIKTQTINKTNENFDHIVWLHIGVAAGNQTIKLEQRAWNEANFSVPDERGWTPKNQSIIENFEFNSFKDTSLPANELINVLASQGFPVELSYNPGRFICNWTYYLSLNATSNSTNESNINLHSLFVHIPLFEQIPKDFQLTFFSCLLDEIVQFLSK
eukprot:TRINITY_DN590_c0_g1_i1.p1 TRINITY_DN590_c0_g1~~TRINITY_DN590_c0_g1_i1.p1  ORF type:complete len:215 (-),score=73.55 TRINITY_DN590_c0_g1_i1:86-730(-)